MSRRVIAIVTALAAVLLLLASAGVLALGFDRLEPRAAADEVFSYDGYAGVLRDHVRDGRVDYAGLAARPERLERFVSTLAEQGPDRTPEAFPTREARFAYHINAYNALALLGVVRHHPVRSVHDVRGILEPTPGFGFFWALGFRVDGSWINLYDLENEVLRDGYGDARVHAAINCASVSCPTLASAPYRPETLDAELDAAMADFASEPRHVRVDDGGRRIVLSAIYDWFRADFDVEARRRGFGEAMLDTVQGYARPGVGAALRRAREADYEVTFATYDWGLNDDGPRGRDAR